MDISEIYNNETVTYLPAEGTLMSVLAMKTASLASKMQNSRELAAEPTSICQYTYIIHKYRSLPRHQFPSLLSFPDCCRLPHVLSKVRDSFSVFLKPLKFVQKPNDHTKNFPFRCKLSILSANTSYYPIYKYYKVQ